MTNSLSSQMPVVTTPPRRRASDRMIDSLLDNVIAAANAQTNTVLHSTTSESEQLKIMRTVLEGFHVKQARIDEILDRWHATREPLTTIATDIGVLDYYQALEASSKLTGLPFFSIEQSAKAAPERAVIDLAKSKNVLDMSVFNGFVPLRVFNPQSNDKKLGVAISDVSKIAEASALIRMPISPVLMSEFDIVRIYRQYFSNVLLELDATIHAATEGKRDETLARKVLALFVKYAAYNQASDIHFFKSIAKLGLVQITIDGVSSLLKTLPEWLFDSILNILILDNQKTDDIQRMHCPGRFVIKDADIEIIGQAVLNNLNFRLQIGNTSNQGDSRGKTSVLRLLSKNMQNVSLSHLGYPYSTINELNGVLNSSAGLFLVVGPTGSGKSTSLYSMMSSMIDPIERSIATIENPIEFHHGAWKQYTLLSNEGDTNEQDGYADIFKSLLRQAPKVILVGEIRDLQVAQIAGQAANTGHLILATLHANNAASAIYRLIHMGMDKQELALIFKGVLAQRLLRSLCVHCREVDTDNLKEVTHVMGTNIHTETVIYKAHPKGCPHCRNTGYSGRRVVHELILADEKVIEMIAAGENAHAIENYALHSKSRATMISEGYRLVAEGVTSLDEVKRTVL